MILDGALADRRTSPLAAKRAKGARPTAKPRQVNEWELCGWMCGKTSVVFRDVSCCRMKTGISGNAK